MGGGEKGRKGEGLKGRKERGKEGLGDGEKGER
jgi:hypothetical protein